MWRLLIWYPCRPMALLGRWCHPQSHKRCNQALKADLANSDNTFSVPRLPRATATARPSSRDPVSVFVSD